MPYKRLDVAIRAAAQAKAPLTIVGRGPEEARLRRLADAVRGRVEFAGWLADDDIRDLYQRCVAVVMPGVEDFGMVPVEAQACGRPVIALAKGGALESVVDGVTGVLVPELGVEPFAAAMTDVASRDFDSSAIRRRAESFGKERFKAEFQRLIDSEDRAADNDSRDVYGRHRSEPAVVSAAACYAQGRGKITDRDVSTRSTSPGATSRGENDK